jgi:hypothetical protein
MVIGKRLKNFHTFRSDVIFSGVVIWYFCCALKSVHYCRWFSTNSVFLSFCSKQFLLEFLDTDRVTFRIGLRGLR